jgi:hypothetical protein
MFCLSGYVRLRPGASPHQVGGTTTGTITIQRSKASRGSNQYSCDKDQNTTEDDLEYGG